MNVPTKGGIIEQINNYAIFFKKLGKEVNFVCEGYSQVSNNDLYDLSKLNVDNIYVIPETDDFTKIIPDSSLLLFLQVRIAKFFVNFFEKNKVIIQYHRNINDATPEIMRDIKFLKAAIKEGEIQLLEPQESIDTIPGLKGAKEFSNYVFEPQIKNTKSVQEIKNIGFISRLTENDNAKNINGVIRIIKQSLELNNNLVFHIYGSGDKQEKFEELGPNVIVHGFVYSKDEIYENLDLVMLPSISEAYPMVLVEAICKGIKVISYKSSNMIEEIVGKQVGKVIPLNNEEQFVKELTNFEPYNRQEVIDYSKKFLFDVQSMSKYFSRVKNPIERRNTAYLFDTRKQGDIVYLDFFSSGYFIELESTIVGSSFPVKKYACHNGVENIYSAIAYNFKKQFFTIEFNVNDFHEFDYLKLYINNKTARIATTRQGTTRIPLNETDNIILENDEFVLEQQIYMQEVDLFSCVNSYQSNENIFLFQDRENKGYDNGEALYKYALESNKYNRENLYFVIEEECDDYYRLIKEGVNVIYRNSLKHRFLFLIASAVCTSHIKRDILIPFENNDYKFYKKSKTIFLQHGITFAESDYKYFLNGLVSPVDMMISTNDTEKELLERITDYSNIALTGFARHDLLNNDMNKMDTIFYFPTWNRKIDMTDFEQTPYYKNIKKFLYSEQIATKLRENTIKIKFLLHPELEEFISLFKCTDVVEILNPAGFNFSKMLSESAMIITDASSIAWDVAYQKKPVLIYAPYETHSSYEGTPMERMGTITKDVTKATDAVIELINNNFEISESQEYEISNFYAFSDKENSKRIMEEIEKII